MENAMKLARERGNLLASQFEKEVERLLKSGAIDRDNIRIGVLFGVAMENVAGNFPVDKKSKDYKNLRCF